MKRFLAIALALPAVAFAQAPADPLAACAPFSELLTEANTRVARVSLQMQQTASELAAVRKELSDLKAANKPSEPAKGK